MRTCACVALPLIHHVPPQAVNMLSLHLAHSLSLHKSSTLSQSHRPQVNCHFLKETFLNNPRIEKVPQFLYWWPPIARLLYFSFIIRIHL